MFTVTLLLLQVELPKRWERMMNLVNYLHHIVLVVLVFSVKGIKVMIYSHIVDCDMP